ncbi:MAG: hypothetical protein U0165_16905 [Polyangiaceae bacterium]
MPPVPPVVPAAPLAPLPPVAVEPELPEPSAPASAPAPPEVCASPSWVESVSPQADMKIAKAPSTFAVFIAAAEATTLPALGLGPKGASFSLRVADSLRLADSDVGQE